MAAERQSSCACVCFGMAYASETVRKASVSRCMSARSASRTASHSACTLAAFSSNAAYLFLPCVSAVGARMPLIAYNCNLATGDVRIAKKIAAAIRAKSGGFRSCKAMGFMLADRGVAQVSMNLVNYEDTPIYMVYETVCTLAEHYGTRVTESEIVGLTPAMAMLECAKFYLKAHDFNCREQVAEYHILDMLAE